MKNTGLKLEPIVPDKDYILGGYGSLGGAVLQQDGQWDAYLPDNEVQSTADFESYACVAFATLNCVEILARKIYGKIVNWSDRFLAIISGTEAFKGNTPQGVAETLRKKGCVNESILPFEQPFYAPIKQNLYTLALAFIAEYSFGHEYVTPLPNDMMVALQYSPLVFSVYAWVQDDKGLYYKPTGAKDTHATVVYGYVEGQYWKCFDSYFADGILLKKIRWDALPQQCKRFTLTRQILVESAWSRFIAQLKALLGL